MATAEHSIDKYSTLPYSDANVLTLTDTQFLPVHGQTVKLEKEVVMKLLIYDGVAIFPL